MSQEQPAPKSAVPYLRFAADGHPYLLGSQCGACGQIFLDERENCPKCAARGQMSEMELPTTGRLYNYSIVYRSFPGVTVPFISAVVDLDGGCSVKGNLLDVPVDPQVIAFDMPVDVVFRDGGQASPAAKGYTSFFFVPRQEAV